jgi:molecular chaperone DnaK
MKTAVVGIDLGTTNSVVAVPGQYPDLGVVFGNVTVLWDDVGRLTHASAICEVAGELSVGNDAKQLAAEGYTPVRFVKKYMGTTKSFAVGNQELLPEEASARVLQHLCDFAGKALGAKITGAVITHPAYFDGLAIGATKRAGEVAGLRVDGLLMEPVAAAMAYCAEDERTTMRVLVYDLGGGTFDVTLIHCSGSDFVPISFGGNRELGGYNFDKKIALKIWGWIKDKGYQLNIDPEAPERDPRWAALMHYAEKLKIELSGKDGTKASARVPAVFKDDTGRMVQLNFSMTQKEFLDLIKKEIDETMRETRRVLDNAKIAPQQLDLLVLVGGSSRIHAVQERLRTEFGLVPQVTDDVLDLSVAVGAAMVAAAAGTSENGVTLGPVPEETNELSVVFSGQVERNDKRPQVADLMVAVSGGASGLQRTKTNAEGKFYLEADLIEDDVNLLQFTITDSAGSVLSDRSFEVRHTREASLTIKEPPKAMLPKAVSVETETGLHVLAEEGVTLPHRGKQSFQTVTELTEIPIRFFQEDIQLTEMVLTGFSRPVPATCRVELEIEIGADYTMKVTAVVPAANITKTQEVKLQPLAIPSLEQLKAEFQKVSQDFQSLLQNTPDGEQKARIGAEGDLLIEEIDAHLHADFPEQLQTYLLIKKLFLLAKQLSTVGGLSPSRAVIEGKFAKARELLGQAIAKKPALAEQQIDRTLDALQQEADRAYQNSDAQVWSNIDHRLDEIVGTLNQAIGGDGPSLAEIPVFVVLAFVQQAIQEARSQVAERSQGGRLSAEIAARCSQELDAAQQKLERVDLSNEQAAKQQIVNVFHQHVLPAQNMAGISAGPGGVLRAL